MNSNPQFQSIDFRFPQTFKDAIKFSRRLSIRHLWIDALCILQDSTDDWDREASAMAEVYANSHLTLAATGASCVSHGLFHTVGRDDAQREVFSSDMHEIYVRQFPRQFEHL
ncbi:HET-domain-containing protein [Amniculicola lignicola CBS 123094]|uniref:HET-domain-containing protein n=1 Tax=Amniculicola lignicola CBS 123094 TaxID=1392246 RepID=A0A6A5W8I6_9PLEO|nr:HET-domain-containing protein [Amniculicola lignicola CBS 123094]